MPPDFVFIPAQEHFGGVAICVALVGERVCARRREILSFWARLATSNPRGIAGLEACFATTVAAAAGVLKPGDLPLY
jgi:hypothetical protein